MKKADFKPTWDNFNLSPVVETFGVNVVLPFAIRATIMLDPNEDEVEIDPADAPFITKVKKDGIEEVYTLNGTTLSVAATPNDVSLLEIERSGEIVYSIFVGQIVPGITVSQNGRLKGIVGNIPSKTSRPYRFGIRAQWNGETADVVKTWVASPADNQITWNTETLPIPQIDSSKVTGRSFYTLGEFKRGQSVEVGIDLYNPDFTALEVKLRAFSGMVANSKHFNGALPMGLSVSNNPFVISGFIPAEAVAGDYFVEAYVDEPYGPTPIILHAKLLGDQFDKFTAVNRLTWVTESDLGTVREGLPSTMKVKAVNSNGGAVTYKLAPGSRPLPAGMSLSANGEIHGKAPHYSANTDVVFSVKAASGAFVATREFRFKLLNSFERPRHLTVKLPLTGPVRRAWQAYASQIDSTRRFRANDPHFGAAVPNILLIRGLRALPITSLEYDEPFELIVGPFKWAKVIENGVHLYDVIYREFFDPMHKAGGFIEDDTNVIEDPVYYPQDASIQIREGTIRNLRSDLANTIGLNVPPAKRKVLGLDGGELLDQWMTTKQDDGSQIGYIAAGVIDYVTAGRGRVVTNGLNYGSIPVGTSVSFDRLLVQEDSASYYYYLGWDRNENDDIEYDAPLSPIDFRIDGVPVAEDTFMHPEPILTWGSAQQGVTFTLRFYNGGTLVREIVDLEAQSLSYTAAMQTEDGDPGFLNVELVAVKDGEESLPVKAAIRLRAGWGLAWGYRYGGAA